MKIRPATRKDFERFFNRPPPMTLRALVGEKDGQVVAIGGYYIQEGVAVAFTDIKENVTKRDMVNGGRELMRMLDRFGGKVVAANESGDTGGLSHFGFVDAGPLWVYEGKR